MTKRGSLDNIVTYEHICDTTADMDNINPNYITLGSTCIVLSGDDSEEMEVYIANSKKEWKPIATGMIGDGSNSGSSSGNPLFIANTVWDDSIENYKLDRTWQEFYDAFEAGQICVIKIANNNEYQEEYVIEVINTILHTYPDEDAQEVYEVNGYYAYSPNDYLVQRTD